MLLSFIVIVIALGALWLSRSNSSTAAPSAQVTAETPQSGPQFLPITGTLRVGSAEISLEVARSTRELQTGLMFRTELADDRGMAFLFPQPGPVEFWMRDTLIPLDIVFMRDGVVTNIVANAPPCENDPCPTFASEADVDSVIELRAGRAAELGIEPGLTLELTYF